MPLSVPGPDDGGARRPLAAVTGATGFIGRYVVAALTSSGWRVRLLLRRVPEGPEWRQSHPQVMVGSLADEAALARLVQGTDAVVHLAGLIKAARREQFFDVNCKAVARMADTVRQVAPETHFVLVSSLAAREPSLSDYAASKRAGEAAALDALGTRVTILRPPAVYGPHDRETLRFFQIARWPRIPLPGRADARAALIHVGDAARLVAGVAAATPRGAVLAMADQHPEGYSWQAVLAAAARAVANPAPRFFQAPQAVLKGVALIGDVARLAGSASMLNSQKLRELRHPDWGVARDELAKPPGWAPSFDLDSGFADAVAWYRFAGWLPG